MSTLTTPTPILTLVKNIVNLTTIRKKLNVTKPIIKWVGGKTQIIDKLIDEYPTTMSNYHEIFLGGGSVLLAILSYKRAGHINITGTINAYDINETLISLYKNIQSKHNELYTTLKQIIDEFNSCNDDEDSILNRKPTNLEEAKAKPENYYYWSREKYNKLSGIDKNGILGTALFIFLNKTCFRGLYRIGPNGFNVPYGNYSQPEIINKEHLQEVHELIQGVIFNHCDFSVPLQKCISSVAGSGVIGIGEFIYLDPPYAPENSKSFVGYNKDGFGLQQHTKLFGLCKELHTKKIKFIMSNADVELLKEYFPSEIYNTQSIIAKRSINSKKPDAKTKELIIKGGF
jgi:DNA adenine methylase